MEKCTWFFWDSVLAPNQKMKSIGDITFLKSDKSVLTWISLARGMNFNWDLHKEYLPFEKYIGFYITKMQKSIQDHHETNPVQK